VSTELTLFAIPFACSLAAHVALREARLPHAIRWVERGTGRLRDGGDYREINPKAKVSALQLADGAVVTENVAVLLCIAELAGGPLAVPAERDARLALYAWLGFVATELHKQVLAPSFDPAAPDETRRDVLARLLPGVLEHPEAALARAPFLLGERFSVADAYLLWSLLLVGQLGVRLQEYPALCAYRGRLLERDSVQGALAIERRALAAG
jgi:glutathione S-transferase